VIFEAAGIMEANKRWKGKEEKTKRFG